ncbi:unnamed protein product [Clavelina lepadiformis]|uniref:Uncharacterized protein n=1 Tax=Clavelina lepadiformis TaxID=159417 RepID=A0ABP0G3P0_CLALP
MCIGTEILNGKLLCDSVNAQGYEYIPGTRCSYVCDKGFAAHSSSEVTCTARGTWSPEPFCERLQNLFPVIQKIGNYSICLMATKSKEIIGREWLLGFVNTTDGCLEADNNARWHWFGQNNIKHAESGLCLTAEMLQRESMLNLDFCDEGDIRQHWDCDAFRSYRLILKGTDLSMDSSYPLIGPVLEIWTHAKSYWITFNEDLDTFASICSYRLVGTCPKISAPLLIAAPGVCSTDKVSEWQKCDLSCEEDAYLLGGVTATECLPTGVWKELTEVQCVNKCPPISLTVGKILNPSRCTSLKIGHHEVCDLSCDVGYELSNGENSMSLFCENGTWSGENVSCVPRCASQPTAPEGGSVTCSRGVCTFVCDPGYRLNSLKNSVLVECLSAGNDNYSNITCERDNQFIIKSKSTSLSGIYPLCLFLHSSGETKKVACDLNDNALYWRWKNDNLQHVQSERCLLAGSLDNWSNVTSAMCNNDDNQQFTWHNYYYPYHLKPKVTSELFVDFGAASLDAPVILRDGYPPFSGEWLTSDIDGNNQTLCSFKQQGVCAPLSPIISAVISPVECAESSSAESVCTITCDAGYTTREGLSFYKLRCLASGLWNSSLSPCIAQSSNEGSCEAPTVSVGLIISPSNCLIQSSLSRGMGCQFSCDPGYHLIGSKVIYCKGGNSWSDAVPICEAYCPRLPNLPGLIRNPEVCSSTQIAVGVNCTENCAEGYSFGDGPNIRACERSGVWTGEIMECQVVCPKLSSSPYLATDDESMIGENRSAVVTTSSCAFGTQLPGSSCSFQCPLTYVAVSGASNVVCLANGTWSSPIPRCIPQNHCPAVSMIGTESVVYERLKDDIAIVPGTAVFMDCAAGYHADGDNQRMCQTNGIWDGEGPTSPACTSLCPPLPVRFLGSILPVECTSQYSREGQSCMLQCIDDAQFSNGNKSLNVICRNGVWSNELPRCISESLTDESEYEAFMMITRSEKTGCLVVNDDDDIVTWNEVLDCNVNEPKHLWKWSQYGGALLNVGRSKCLQPMDKTANITSLVVGDCAQAMENSFICGDPKSSVERYHLYYHPNETWGMAYSKDVVTSAPLGILLHQITIPAIKSYQKFYAGINVHANADINYSEVGDHPVCAYACRGTITQDSKEGYLSSPGYHQNRVFPAYSNCEWTIVGSNDVKISITLLDIDLEGESTSDDPCQFDCIKVFSGPVNDELYWTMLKIFTGQNIAAYLPEHGGNSVASVLGNMYIKFSSSGIGQHKGFVISYRFDEIVPPEGCGVVDESLWSSTATSQSPVGRKASIERWPWLVSIRGKDSILNKANHRCTGVLVNDQTVVSSAHCAGFMVKTFAENMTVMLGVGQTSQHAMFEKHHVLERIFVHPKYDYQHRTNDIAVWKLSEPVEFSKTIQPICFPMDGHAIHDVFSSCYAVGWNRLRNGEVVDVLVEYKMNIVTNMLCEKELGIGSQSAFVCSSHDGLDAFGLSRTNFSEPLICKFRERWYLAGVSSYTHVGTSRALRLYSDVNSHSNWLSKTIFRTSVVSYQSRNLELLQHIF